jgi:ribosomal-protein-alanine N-acetyltransferase
MMTDVRFRSLTPDDARELSYLELEIFPAPWSENALRSCLEQANVEGEAAVVEGGIVGYLFAQFAADEAHLLNVGVRNKYRRLGIGRQLLERFLERCRQKGVRMCLLEVRLGNRIAQKLYFQHGFAPVSIRKKYYPNGEDALILMKQL